MALTQGCLDILLQILASNKCTRFAWKLFFLYVITFSAGRLQWVISNWKHTKDFEQLCYYLLVLSLSAIGWSACAVIEKHTNESVYLITQRFKLVPHMPDKFNRPHEVFMRFCVWELSQGFLAVPLIFGGIPLIRTYDISQVLLVFFTKHLIGTSKLTAWQLNIPIKIVSFVCSFLIVLQLVIVVLVIILISVIALESMIIISTQDLFPLQKIFSLKIFKPYSFYTCLRTFRELQILIIISNLIIGRFMGVLAGMGIISTAVGGYIAVSMYSSKHIPILLYMCACLIFVIGVAVDFLLITLAAIPNKQVETFKSYWRYQFKSRKEKLDLMACPPVGFCVGVVSRVKKYTALVIVDTELNFSATMVLTERNM